MWTNLEQQAQEEMKKKRETKKEISCKEEEEAKEEATEENKEEVKKVNETILPDWLEKYIIYKFNLYYRTGICFIQAIATFALASCLISILRLWKICHPFFMSSHYLWRTYYHGPTVTKSLNLPSMVFG